LGVMAAKKAKMPLLNDASAGPIACGGY
jgi:hypothetical protein